MNCSVGVITGSAAPTGRNVVSLVEADGGKPHLRGWIHRKHRARLRRLRHQAVRGDSRRLLREGRKAIAMLSGLATADPQDIDQQIGLTRSGRRAAAWWYH